MVFCRAYAACSLWALGHPAQALQTVADGLVVAYELSHPYSQAFALNLAAMLHQFRGDRQGAQEQAEAAITLSTEQDFPAWLKYGTILRGWALAERGKRDEAITEIRRGQAIYETAVSMLEVYYLALMGEVYWKAGQAEQGLVLLAEAFDVVRKTGARFWEPELYRLKGELSLEVGAQNQRDAEVCFHQAIDVARDQSAKSLELRAGISLGRLWKKQGRKTEARTLVAEIYSWFTEGFDTADLKDAKSLLEDRS